MLRMNRFFTLVTVLALVLFASQSTSTFVLAQDSDPTGAGPSDTSGPGTDSAVLAAAVPGGPGYIAISPFEFTPYISPSFPGQPPNYSFQSIYNPGPNASWFDAPLLLPNGVIIRKLVAYYYDNNQTGNMAVYLYQCPLGWEGCNTMASVSTTGYSDSFRTAEDTTIAYSSIDTSSYSYHLEMSLPPGSTVRVQGFRIDYANTSLLPLIQK